MYFQTRITLSVVDKIKQSKYGTRELDLLKIFNYKAKYQHGEWE
jgi:hypothetical protein